MNDTSLPTPAPGSRPPVRQLGRKVAAGVVWGMLYKLVERGLGLVSTLVLARFLMPDDFGLVVIATSIVALLELMRQFGFDAALIQLKTVTKDHFDTAWTFSALLGIAIATLLLVSAPAVAAFYDDPRLHPVLWALSIASLLNGFESNGPIMFRKELRWRQDFLFQATRKTAAVAFTIPLAILWQNYWALVVGTIAGRAASFVVSYVITPHRPRFTLSAKDDLWHFSKWTFITNVLAFVRQRVPNLMIGRFSSAASVGLFGMARDITRLPTVELVAPINRAAFPGYAKISDDLPRLQQAYLKLLGAIALLVIPAGVGMSVAADLLVRVFLGRNWVGTVPAMQILGVYCAMAALQQGNANAIYLAIGKPKLQSVMLVVFIAVLIPAVVLLAPKYGHVGAALAYLIAALVAVPVNLVNVCSCLAMPSSRLLGVLWRPALAALAMAGTVLAIRPLFGTTETFTGAIVALAAVVAAGAAVYVTMLFGAWMAVGRPPGPEQWVLEELRRRFGKRRRNGS